MAKKGTTKYKSNKQEKDVAKAFGGKQVIASGALWFASSDVRNDKFLIECKTTEKEYYSLTAKVWEKICEEAVRDHMRIPIMVIDLEDRDRVVVFNPKDFETPMKSPYDCTYNGDNQKSFRVSVNGLLEAEEDMGEYIYGRLFIICGKKENMLMYMRMKDFEDRFKEELL